MVNHGSIPCFCKKCTSVTCLIKSGLNSIFPLLKLTNYAFYIFIHGILQLSWFTIENKKVSFKNKYYKQIFYILIQFYQAKHLYMLGIGKVQEQG